MYCNKAESVTMYMKDDTEEDVDDDACNKQQGHSGYHDDDKGDNQCTVIKQRVLQCIWKMTQRKM